MEEQLATRVSDSALRPFLSAPDEAEAERLLAQLLSDHAEPITRGIIGRKLSISRSSSIAGQEDAEDVYSEVLVQLLSRLQRARANPDANAINDFRGYVAVTTYNACHQHLRQKYPHRWRLKNRLRYLLTHTSGLALWENAGAEWLCGLAFQQGRTKEGERGKPLEPVRDNPRTLERAGLSTENLHFVRLTDLVKAIFQWVGAPVEMDDLVKTVAELQGIKDHPVVGRAVDGRDADAPECLPDAHANVASEVERRMYLRRLWAEIVQLPLRQRIALLLNLRDEQEGVLALLPLMGLATVRQLAETLAIPAEQFARLWNELPLEDALIAEHLGVTRQQVINLRKSARARLARRMRAFEETD
jgi:RNA polymerase sigma factor (sigma-70 family)